MATPSDVALRPSARRPLVVRRGTLALAAVLGLLLPAVPAQAVPSTSAEVAELVAARGHDLEALAEEFNEARETLAAQTKAAQDAAIALQQAQAGLATAQQHVVGIARAAYTGEGQGSLRALLTSESVDDFVDRVTTLQTIAGHQNGIVDQAATANVAAAQAQAVAAKSAADAQAQFDEVSAQQADLEAQIAEYQAVYDRLSAQEQAAVTASPHEERASRAERTEVPVASGPIVANSQAAQIAVDTAMAQRGKPYVWAAAGPGSFDCSGLVQYAYAAAGISLPHSSRMQAVVGQAVSRDELQPGDLVAFYSPISHIGIYIGDGQMVHAPSSGDVVKVSPIDRIGGITAMTRIAG
ncbi:MAG: Cell wall-associated hydrolase, invasion-associated protein [Blastococcus sp.]|jgi:cell wall-associated NlpC family hydrolase|nr:Cell wall-associated hydrolase, invasion-associated protein [Blastococcus sp.]